MNKKKTSQTKSKQNVHLFTSVAKKTSSLKKYNHKSKLFENKRYRF